MTRYERLKAMSIEEVAAEIIRLRVTDDYCKSDCVEAENIDCMDCCRYELECCIRWLNEEVEEVEGPAA